MPSTRVRGHVVRAAARLKTFSTVPMKCTCWLCCEHMKQLASSQTPDSVSGSIQLPSPRRADGLRESHIQDRSSQNGEGQRKLHHAYWTSENDCVFYQHCRLVGHQMGSLGSHIQFTPTLNNRWLVHKGFVAFAPSVPRQSLQVSPVMFRTDIS